MKKFIIALTLLSTPVFSCDKCLKYYLEKELYESEIILDDMLDNKIEDEDDIPFFFFMLGRNDAFYEIIMKTEKKCTMEDYE